MLLSLLWRLPHAQVREALPRLAARALPKVLLCLKAAARAAVALTLVDAGLFLWMLAADFASECADGFNHFSYQALRVSRQ